uniref:Uncharacterized protein n=1 Tax=Anguilla anguilla TaxID=7936 RepID=A0A0E9U7T5_ANGAN
MRPQSLSHALSVRSPLLFGEKKQSSSKSFFVLFFKPQTIKTRSTSTQFFLLFTDF